MGELASAGIAPGREAILHDGARCGQIVTCKVQNRDRASFVAETQHKVSSEISKAPGVYPEFSETGRGARSEPSTKSYSNSTIAAVIIVCLLYIAVGKVRNLLLVLVNVPFALVAGMLAA